MRIVEIREKTLPIASPIRNAYIDFSKMTLSVVAVVTIAADLGLGGNESHPDLFQPFGGFPDGVKVDGSYVTLPELPGIGFEGKADLYREMKALAA